MSETKNILLQLHSLHLRVKDLHEEAEEGPRKLRRYQAKIDHQQRLLQDTQEAIKHLKVTIHEKEVTMKGNTQKIAKHQQQMNEASSKKEYDALRAEIDHERQANRVLEDEILMAMGDLEENTKQVPEIEKAVKQAQEDYRKAQEELAGRQSDLEMRLAAVKVEVQTVEAGLPGDTRNLYQRQVQARGADALASAAGRSCTGCYTDITPQNYNDLRNGRIIVCKSCGRLLYLPA